MSVRPLWRRFSRRFLSSARSFLMRFAISSGRLSVGNEGGIGIGDKGPGEDGGDNVGDNGGDCGGDACLQ